MNDVRSLRLEESTAADIVSIVEKYHGGENGGSDSRCAPYDSSYFVRVANDSINSIGLRFPFLRFAFKPQGVVAVFILNRGRLRCMSYTVGSYPPHDWKELMVEAQALPEVQGISWPLSRPFDVEYVGGNVWHFRTNLKPGARPEELRLAFDFDLSCLGRFGGCVAACELMPAAWTEYEKKAEERGSEIPRHELNDKRCLKSSALNGAAALINAESEIHFSNKVLSPAPFSICWRIGGGKAVNDFFGEWARFHFCRLVWIGGGPDAGGETFHCQGAGF